MSSGFNHAVVEGLPAASDLRTYEQQARLATVADPRLRQETSGFFDAGWIGSIVELASPVVEQAAPDGAAEIVVRRRRLGGACQKADRGQQRSDALADRRDREPAACFQHSLHRIRLLNLAGPQRSGHQNFTTVYPAAQGSVSGNSAPNSRYSSRLLRASLVMPTFSAGSIL